MTHKSIIYPALIICAPQALLLAFWGLMRAAGIDPAAAGLTYVIASGVALAIGSLTSFMGLFGVEGTGWLDEDADERRRIAKARDEEMRRLDEAIGIPRIPVRK